MKLNLTNNKIDYLDEHVFGSLLKESKQSPFFINTFNCDDCRSIWLINNHYSHFQLENINCNNTHKVTD